MSGAAAARLALAAALIFTVLLGGTEVGRLVTEVRALAAIVGGAVIASYLWFGLRRTDATDRLVVLALFLFLLTCVTSRFPRMSFESATSALAYTSAYFLARGALATPAARRLAITCLLLVGLAVAALYSIVWGSVWIRWLAAPGEGMPPLNLQLPGLLYGHQYPAASLLAMLLPAISAVALQKRRFVLWLPLLPALFVIVASGGRTIWLAGVMALAVAAMYRRGGKISWSRRQVVLALGTGAVTALLALSAMPRILTTGTIELRLAIWRTVIEEWTKSPLVGFGPGSFGRQFALTDYYATHEDNVPHAHNLIVQTLFESGLVGLLGLTVLILAFALAVRRWPPYKSTLAGIAFFAIASITDNPAVVPALVATLIAWAALATPRLKPEPEPARLVLRPVLVAGAAVIAGASLATLAAAASYDRARQAATLGNSEQAVAAMSAAAHLDPSFAMYRRDFGAWLVSHGEPARGIAELELAVSLNPSDLGAYRALAIGYSELRAWPAALAAGANATSAHPSRGRNALTLAYVAQLSGDTRRRDEALVSALRWAPWLPAAPQWSAIFPEADVQALLQKTSLSWLDDPTSSSRNRNARTWAAAVSGRDPPRDASAADLAQAMVVSCQLADAKVALAAMKASATVDTETVKARLLFAQIERTDDRGPIVVLIHLLDPGLANAIREPTTARPVAADQFYDNRYYHRISATSPLGPVLPTSSGALGEWLRDPVASADRGAPASGLARCR